MDSTGDSLENSVVQGLCVLLNVCVLSFHFCARFVLYVLCDVCCMRFLCLVSGLLDWFCLFLWACSSCALFLPFYLWCVCVSYWKMNGKRFQIHLRPPPPFPAICMIHTWCILKYLSFYLHIPVSLSSLSISLVLDSSIPLPIYLSNYISLHPNHYLLSMDLSILSLDQSIISWPRYL